MCSWDQVQTGPVQIQTGPVRTRLRIKRRCEIFAAGLGSVSRDSVSGGESGLLWLQSFQMPWENEAGGFGGVITPVCSCSSLHHTPKETRHILREGVKSCVWLWENHCLTGVCSSAGRQSHPEAEAGLQGLNSWSCFVAYFPKQTLQERQPRSPKRLISVSPSAAAADADVASLQRNIKISLSRGSEAPMILILLQLRPCFKSQIRTGAGHLVLTFTKSCSHFYTRLLCLWSVFCRWNMIQIWELHCFFELL